MKKVFLLFVFAFSLSINAQEKSEDNFKKTDEVLSEVVKKSLVVAEKTGNFVIEQAPMLLHEFYAWHIWSDIFWIVFGLLIFLCGRYIPYCWLTSESQGKYSVKFFKKYGSQDGISRDPSASWIIFSITTFSSIIVMIINIYDLAYILVAPKLYLIDYFIK
jgi:hypothetical protein